MWDWLYLSISKLQRQSRWNLVMDKYFHPMFYLGIWLHIHYGIKVNVSKKCPTHRKISCLDDVIQWKRSHARGAFSSQRSLIWSCDFFFSISQVVGDLRRRYHALWVKHIPGKQVTVISVGNSGDEPHTSRCESNMYIYAFGPKCSINHYHSYIVMEHPYWRTFPFNFNCSFILTFSWRQMPEIGILMCLFLLVLI